MTMESTSLIEETLKDGDIDSFECCVEKIVHSGYSGVYNWKSMAMIIEETPSDITKKFLTNIMVSPAVFNMQAKKMLPLKGEI